MVKKIVKQFLTSVLVVVAATNMLTISACGKKIEAPEKSAEQAQADRAASATKARESAVFGDQLKAMDKAKATADEAAKVAEERLKKADQ